MKNTIVLNFKNIVSEMENKKLNLCFFKKQKYLLEDIQGNLYQMETYWVGSYLDKLIKDGITVEFNLVDAEKTKNIEEWEKEIWSVKEVKEFIEKHRRFWI